MTTHDRRPPIGTMLRVHAPAVDDPFLIGIADAYVPVTAHQGQYVYVGNWGRFHVLDDKCGPGRWAVGDASFVWEQSDAP